MFYLLLFLLIAAVVYVGWRATRAQSAKPTRRVIGPDDDPDFLWRIGRGDNRPN